MRNNRNGLLFFGIACVAENKYPPLTRCWKDLETRFIMFGHPKGFPSGAKNQIEDMILDKLFYFDEAESLTARYETFMRLAGPYWMSCVTKNESAPILDPDHYLSYLDPSLH